MSKTRFLFLFIPLLAWAGLAQTGAVTKPQEAAIKNYILSQDGGNRLLAQESLSDAEINEALQKVLRLLPLADSLYSKKKRANEQYLSNMNFQVDGMKRALEEFENTDVVYKEADFKKNLETRLKRVCCISMQRVKQRKQGGTPVETDEDTY